jgi:hypothetical protein
MYKGEEDRVPRRGREKRTACGGGAGEEDCVRRKGAGEEDCVRWRERDRATGTE